MYFVTVGEVYVGCEQQYVFTTLGSCIAVVAWHKQLHIVGMCHYLLAEPPGNVLTNKKEFYGCHALPTLEQNLQKYAALDQFQFALFGGGSLFSLEKESFDVARKNTALAYQWANNKGIVFRENSVGGEICRQIKINNDSGDIFNIEYPMSGAYIA